MNNIKLVAELREQLEKRQLEVKKCPGVYRWWFPETEAEKLLAKFKSPLQHEGRILQEKNIEGATYIALYFGISSDMSRRIRWHIRGPFKNSTLRRTLRSIIAPKKNDKDAEALVNKLIDSCYWEWDYADNTEQAECMETAELAQKKFSYPLNISKNNTMPTEWSSELKQMRAKLKNE